ncbi:hydantoinase/oxoprolinase family protein [Vineibacter terrae]|uniref:hydantoinase/oxoprolinase family protein n=1 Tax=Vineibacter terrae TaxID=2586908 RepID=UPI002E2F7DBF|nr:hydantoinase/oxoprolinase family protein [Vineibacter terrae]HEX2892315.1 hydantoinase/oxoprolinase family protein [Vineibacter terrae]
MSYRLGVDIGGTFTDLALFDERNSAMTIHKLLTTPDDPARAVLQGVHELLAMAGAPIEHVTALIHGTTLITNAVIERKGSRCAMLTTAGFRDVLDIGIENRYDQFDMRLKYPRPLVERTLQLEVDERVGPDGEIRRPLDEDEVRCVVARAVERGAESLAVCLLHAYVQPAHENRIRAIVESAFPDLPVSTSAEVLPFMREFERWTTTTINAYTQRMADSYLRRLEDGLAGMRFSGQFYIMASNGGTVTPATARRFPVRLLESGPAAGVLMSSHLGRLLEAPNLLSFDMGGTTAKGALVIGGEPQKKYELEVAHVHEHKAGSGFTVKIPVIDMVEIGAGGGSIADIDERGVIRVGPRSAGAVPGPACYGRGGTEPTITDANVLLGFLDPAFFLGGRMRLDFEAAGTAMRQRVAEPLGVSLMRAAWGVHQTVNENMAQAFRLHASERGYDYRNFTMTAFGGCGPIHAARIARILHIPRVIFPVGAGVMSAFGLLVSPLSFETVRSHPLAVDHMTDDDLAAAFAAPIAEATSFLDRAGVPARDIRVKRRLDMRYRGQGYEIEVVLPDSDGRLTGVADLPGLFNHEYARIFSAAQLNEPLEIVNLKVEALGPRPAMAKGCHLAGIASGARLKGSRQVYRPEADDLVDCPVYDRYALRPGDVVAGPALIEERESTCVINSGDAVRVDADLNLIADIALSGRN